MRKSILNASLGCTILLTLVYCSKTPEKPSSDQSVDSTKTTVPAIKDSVKTSEDSLALKVKDYINLQYLKPEDLKTIAPAERKFNISEIGKYPSNPSLISATKETPETNSIKIFESNTSKAYSF